VFTNSRKLANEYFAAPQATAPIIKDMWRA
jgi:hypothetical protein